MIPGQIWICEHKTTSKDITPGSIYWKRLTLDAQVSNYIAGVRALGHEPAGVLYDVIAKPTIRPAKATAVESRKYTQPSSKACPECKRKAPSYPAPHAFSGEGALISCGEAPPHGSLICAEGRLVTDAGGTLYANMRDTDETPEEYRERLRADIGANPEAYYQRSTIVRLAEEERDAAYDVWTTARSLREAELSQRWPRNVDACDQYGKLCPYFDVCSGTAAISDPARFRDAEEHEELKPETTANRHLPLVTTSSLRSFRSCPRRYFHAYVQRRREIETADALRFGTLIHAGLEAWWRSGSLDKALAAMAGEADPFERVKAEELILGYHVRWIDAPLQVLAVEEEFVAPLVNPETGAESRTFLRGGKIDALARVTEAACGKTGDAS
jgi:hypothetical protein